MSDYRIVAEELGKRFEHRPGAAPGNWRSLLQAVRRRRRPEPFWALRGVSFRVRGGEMLGVVGRNGAGKSTLLCLLGGLSDPTTGRVELHGRVGGLLELSGGFVGDLTGRENALLAGVVAGLTRAEVRARLGEIVAFAEIGDFLDEPVRTYSTGMRMRLAFAVAVHQEPEVLLVDEFLAVGDLAFQAKCRARIAALRLQGCAVVVVSHALGDVRDACDRVLWLRDGAVAALDEPKVVIELFRREMHARTLDRTPGPCREFLADGQRLKPDQERLGSAEMEIVRVEILSGETMRSGDPFAVTLDYRCNRPAPRPIFNVSIVREDGIVCLDTNTESARISTEALPPAGQIRFSIDRLELGAGRYFVNVGIFQSKWSHAYDYHWRVHELMVTGAAEHQGIAAPGCRWEAEGWSGTDLRPATAAVPVR